MPKRGRPFVFLSLLVLILGLGLVSCAARPNADELTAAGLAAQRAGKWREAVPYWQKAIMDPTVSKPQLARIDYEEGRALGVLCRYAEAQNAFLAAYTVDQESKGPAWAPLFELARMLLVQGKYPEAARFYALGFKEENGALKDMPFDAAELWDEYAQALKWTDQLAEYERAMKNSQSLRFAHPDAKRKTFRTPFGAQCGHESGKPVSNQ